MGIEEDRRRALRVAGLAYAMEGRAGLARLAKGDPVAYVQAAAELIPDAVREAILESLASLSEGERETIRCHIRRLAIRLVESDVPTHRENAGDR
jgi:hypothetical protein